MLRLEKITRANVRAVVDMGMLPEDQGFVAPNALSLAQAYVEQGQALPFALYDESCLVGFMMLGDAAPDEPLSPLLWRLLIDPAHRRKGYARRAIDLAAGFFRRRGQRQLYLSYVPGNAGALRLYEAAGFRPTGAVEDGEVVMVLAL